MTSPLTIPIIGELFTILRTWLQGWQKVRQATDDRKAELLRQQGSWEQIMATGSVTSWKDEWLTILFSIPLIGAFIPDVVPHIQTGFTVLDGMPDWYIYTVSVIVAASFGVRSVIGMMNKKGKTA